MFDESTLSGSVEFTGYEERGKNYMKFNFQCLKADVSLLPIDNIPQGSSCWILDTQEVLVFSKKLKTWY